MKVYAGRDGKPVVQCECGFKIVKDGVLRTRVALIDRGYICPKCPNCKRMSESISLTIFIPTN